MENIDIIKDNVIEGLRKKVAELEHFEKECKQNMKALQEANKTLEALLDYIPEAITIVEGPDVTVRKINKFGREFVGKPAEELIGISLEERIERWVVYNMDGTKTDKTQLPVFRAIKTGEVVLNDERIVKNSNGEMVTVLINAGPILDENGKISGAIAVWRDISDRKKAEEKLRKANKELQNALKNISVLSGLIPICSSCKRVRDAKGEWSNVEKYVSDHTQAEFTHTICEECAKKLYPEVFKGDDK